MRKWIALLLAVVFALLPAGCAVQQAPAQTTQTPQPGGTPADEAFDIRVSWAGITEDGRIYSESLNPETMAISAVQHLPIHKFDTLEELDRFRVTFADSLDLEGGYDEVPSFNQVTADYDEAFFEDNTLMLVYVPSPSGSYRYGVNGIYCSAPDFSIHVAQANDPAECTDDAAGWFVTLAVPDSMIADCTNFDADLNNTLVSDPMPIAE